VTLPKSQREGSVHEVGEWETTRDESTQRERAVLERIGWRSSRGDRRGERESIIKERRLWTPPTTR